VTSCDLEASWAPSFRGLFVPIGRRNPEIDPCWMDYPFYLAWECPGFPLGEIEAVAR